MPLTQLDQYVATGTYIRFTFCRTSESGKTQIWDIRNSENRSLLGYVEWAGSWRKYIFTPVTNDRLIFEETCLREIAEFIETKTQEHRTAKKKAASGN